MPEYGMLVDYQYCTGCLACEVACKQEYGRPAGKVGGVKVVESIQELTGGDLDITYYPLFTRLCTFCAPRVRQGLSPACVQHCMAGILTFGPTEALARQAPEKRKAVLWTAGR